MKKNDYIGHSEEELKGVEQSLVFSIKGIESEINNYKEQILKLSKRKKELQKKIELVNEAKTYCNTIEEEYVIRVYSKTQTKYVGEEKKVYYYSRSDFKEYVIYYFVVESVNKEDNNKGRTIKTQSLEYVYKDKKIMTELMVDAIKQYNIKKCYLYNNVKVAKSLFEKLGCKVIEQL